MAKGSKKDEQRQGARPYPSPFFSNYDYTEDEPDETSPGGGLYHGKMDKYKSVKDFVEKRRKKNKKRKDACRARIFKLLSI